MITEKLAALLRTKDWEKVTRKPRDHHDLYAGPVFEFSEITEKEIEEFIGSSPTVDASGNVIDVWLEDDDFVYVLAPVWSGDLVIKRVLRRFDKNVVSGILSSYQIPEEAKSDE